MKSMKYLSLSILAWYMVAWFFSACEPLGRTFDCTIVVEKEIPDLYMIVYKYKRGEEPIKKDTILLHETHKEFVLESLGPFSKNPPETEIKKEVIELSADFFFADSIGVYSIADNRLKAMFYPPWRENTSGKTSSTCYPNPYSTSSWTFHLDKKQYAKQDWGVNIGKSVYTLKPTNNE